MKNMKQANPRRQNGLFRDALITNFVKTVLLLLSGTAFCGAAVDHRIGTTGGPIMRVYGNENLIANGDTTPAVEDGTAFGEIPVGARKANNFTITNVGSEVLRLGSFYINGSDDFRQPARTMNIPFIFPGESLTYQFTFAPEAHDSEVDATIKIIYCDDEFKSYFTYTFTVGGQSPAEFATNSTPTKWLYEKGLVDGDYDAAALSDTDQDGMLAWEEYVMGTDPTDGGSVFQVTPVISNGTTGGPIMRVYGNENLIANGDTTPAVEDGTAFGEIPVGAKKVNDFTITNTGPEFLHLWGIASSAPDDFILPDRNKNIVLISPGESLTFQLTFAPEAHDSEVDATISISCNGWPFNQDRYTFTFTVSGQSPTQFVTDSSTPTKWLYEKGLVDGDYDAAALSDTDQDGMLAWEEYVMGTDPTDGGSVFAVSTVISNGQVGLEIPASSKPGTPVLIYRSINLEEGWQHIGTSSLPSTNEGPTTWIDEEASISSWPNVYYKISVSTD
jgi:hypothetical protein